MKNPLLSLRDISLAFGVKPLFNNLSLTIYPNDRICLFGRNGEGKTSLLKVIAGLYEIDKGERWTLPGIKVGYLPQSITLDSEFEKLSVSDFVLKEIIHQDGIENFRYLVDIILQPLHLEPNSIINNLSGGLLRRAFLARSLINHPDILLLDEPTNHLDIESIEWLEGFINNYSGAVICISHDRTFLKNISNKTFWLDRGMNRTYQRGFEFFEAWSIEVLEQEQRELEKMGKKLTEEEQWKVQGVSARRKRNQKRLQDLYALREKVVKGKSHQQKLLNKIKLDPLAPALSSKIVFEFKEVGKSYNGKRILDSLSLRVMRGEVIGIVGPNGTGKTTFLKLLVGDESPDSGQIKIGKTVSLTYYDQTRTQVNLNDTLWEALCSEGGEHIKVGEKLMHVVAYLKAFLFDPKQAKDKVATLSGGQLNRLLLAKALASPGSLLILDEPTNDLDMDTLDMIKDILYEYSGTLLIVSHDRDFLDSLTTKLLYFKGDGVIEEFIGTYEELRAAQLKKSTIKPAVKTKVSEIEKQPVNQKEKAKLTYILQRELDLIPLQIDKLDQEIKDLETSLAAPNLYQNDEEEFHKKSERLASALQELDLLWNRWQVIEKSK